MGNFSNFAKKYKDTDKKRFINYNIMKRRLSLVLTAAMIATVPVSMNAFDLTQIAKGAVKTVQAVTVSDTQVQSYVKQYVTGLDKQSKLAPANNKYSVRLAKITEGLTSVDGIPLNFKVYLTSDVNAFACADGSVRVYSGLMDLMSDDEVLGVIGHEIGHVAHKDTKKAFKAALLSSAARDALMSTGGLVGTLSGSQIGAIGEKLANTSYSKKQESNADAYGYRFLKKCGKNPWAMALAFKKLLNLENGGNGLGAKVKQLFSDHPATSSRIKNIEKMANKDGLTPPEGYTMLSK